MPTPTRFSETCDITSFSKIRQLFISSESDFCSLQQEIWPGASQRHARLVVEQPIFGTKCQFHCIPIQGNPSGETTAVYVLNWFEKDGTVEPSDVLAKKPAPAKVRDWGAAKIRQQTCRTFGPLIPRICGGWPRSLRRHGARGLGSTWGFLPRFTDQFEVGIKESQTTTLDATELNLKWRKYDLCFYRISALKNIL